MRSSSATTKATWRCFVRDARDLGEKMRDAFVVNGVRSVEAETIEAEGVEPVAHVAQHVRAHHLVREVGRLSPRAREARGERVRNEPAQPIAGRAEVVEDHVEDDREPGARGRRPRTPRDPRASRRRRERGVVGHSVRNPNRAGPRMTRDRHELDGGGRQALRRELSLLRRRPVRSLGGKRPDVEFVDGGGLAALRAVWMLFTE